MKLIAPYFKIIDYTMFVALMIFIMVPKDFDIMIASLIYTGITAIISLNLIAFLFDGKSIKSLAIKFLAIFCLGVEVAVAIIVSSSYRGSMFEDAPTWLFFSVVLPPAFDIFLSALIFDKATVNNEAVLESENNPSHDFSEKIRNHSSSNFPTHEISALLPITNSEDQIVMLKYIGAFQNVLRCKPDGLIVWKAELPTKSNDVYTNIEWKDNQLRAFSRSCIVANLDVETGKIIPSNGMLKQKAA